MPKKIKPKVTYYIDKSNKNKDGKCPIKANVTIAYKNTTKLVDHVLKSDWNPKSQRINAPRPGKYNNHELINAKLDQLKTDFETFADNCTLNRIPLTPQVVKQFFQGKRLITEKSFWPAYDEYRRKVAAFVPFRLILQGIGFRSRQTAKNSGMIFWGPPPGIL